MERWRPARGWHSPQSLISMSPTVWVLGAASHEARRRQARPEVRRLFIVTGRPVRDDCAGRAEVTFIQSSSMSFISAVQTLTPHTSHLTPHQNWQEDTVSIEDNGQCTDQLLNSQSTLSTVRFLILISPLIHCYYQVHVGQSITESTQTLNVMNRQNVISLRNHLSSWLWLTVILSLESQTQSKS